MTLRHFQYDLLSTYSYTLYANMWIYTCTIDVIQYFAWKFILISCTYICSDTYVYNVFPCFYRQGITVLKFHPKYTTVFRFQRKSLIVGLVISGAISFVVKRMWNWEKSKRISLIKGFKVWLNANLSWCGSFRTLYNFFIPDRLPGTKVSKQVEHVFLFLISKGR